MSGSLTENGPWGSSGRWCGGGRLEGGRLSGRFVGPRDCDYRSPLKAARCMDPCCACEAS